MFKRKDGLWQDSVQINGQRRTFAGKTQSAVKKKIQAAGLQHEKTMTFEAVADDFAEERFDDLAPGSLVVYRPALRAAVETFGDFDISEITPHDVAQYLARLSRRYAQKTVGNYRTMLSQVFKYAINEKGLKISNPCQYIALPASSIKPEERLPLTPEQRAEIDKTRPDEFLLAFLIVNTGARLGEACALQWADVDFDAQTININKAAHWNGNRPYIGKLKTKNAARLVPLLSPLRDMLQQQPKHKKTDYIVSGPDLLTMSQLERRWGQFCAAHGLAYTVEKVWRENGTPRTRKKILTTINRHQLRHDYATSLFRAGLPVKSVQHLLGHADFGTTMDIYVHWQRASVDDAREQIEQYLKKEKDRGGV